MELYSFFRWVIQGPNNSFSAENKSNEVHKCAMSLAQSTVSMCLTERQIKVEWYPIYGPKSLFKFGEKRPIVCDCTREQKINFEGFTQNGCYGNQPQPFQVVFYSIDANISCSFTKQDLTVKKGYRGSFCFFLCNELKFLVVNSCFQCFLQAFLPGPAEGWNRS